MQAENICRDVFDCSHMFYFTSLITQLLYMIITRNRWKIWIVIQNKGWYFLSFKSCMYNANILGKTWVLSLRLEVRISFLINRSAIPIHSIVHRCWPRMQPQLRQWHRNGGHLNLNANQVRTNNCIGVDKYASVFSSSMLDVSAHMLIKTMLVHTWNIYLEIQRFVWRQCI